MSDADLMTSVGQYVVERPSRARVFEQLGIDNNGMAYGRFLATGLRPAFLDRLKYSGVELGTELFERQVLGTDGSPK